MQYRTRNPNSFAMDEPQVLREIIAKHEPDAVRGVVRIDYRNSFPSSFFARKTTILLNGVIGARSELVTANQTFAKSVCTQQRRGMLERKIINGLEYLSLTEKGRMQMKNYSDKLSSG